MTPKESDWYSRPQKCCPPPLAHRPPPHPPHAAAPLVPAVPVPLPSPAVEWLTHLCRSVIRAGTAYPYRWDMGMQLRVSAILSPLKEEAEIVHRKDAGVGDNLSMTG